MNKSDVIANLLAFQLKHNVSLTDYVISAGAALVLYDLREHTVDIDIAVKPALWARMGELNLPETHGDYGTVREVDEFLIDLHLMDMTHRPSWDLVHGFPSLTPHELLAQKVKLNRPKDQQDIARLRAYLNRTA
jgi:hypothetical protein